MKQPFSVSCLLLEWLVGHVGGLALGALGLCEAAMGALVMARRSAVQDSKWAPEALCPAFQTKSLEDLCRSCMGIYGISESFQF